MFEALFRVSAPSEQLGRYTVLGTLGSGGMGTVLEAFDRTLDRRVAIKVLHEGIGDRQRLLREAQSLAKLSHPNVVQIYEVGEPEGQMFIAMELVEGSSLRAWMRQQPRPDWLECVNIFVQAARGLAAAHAQGLIHRDFKPDNVLVGTDGRALVADFGLARPVVFESDVKAQTMVETRSSDRITAPHEVVPLTRSGAVLGTIAYMAPEQVRGAKVDARADQFSFCASMYEAVYGQRPFDANTLMGRIVALEGDLPEPESLGNAPRWLHGLLVRGLSIDPGDRFESMDDLLRELSRPRGRWRNASLLATALAGSVGVGLAFSPESVEPCQIDSTALGGAWSPTTREALRSAFAVAGPAAEQAAGIVERSLDDWSGGWLGSLRSACEATHVAGTQSEARLDRRSGCLERQRREAEAIVERLTSPDGKGVRHAFELLGNLPDVAVCDDPRLEQTSHPLPADAAERESILAAYGQISQARAFATSGRVDEADVIAEELEPTVRSLGHLPLTLEFRFLTAQRAWWRGQIDAAVLAIRDVIHESEVAGFDELSATLRTKLAWRTVGYWGESTRQADMLDEAEIAVARVGRSGDPRELVIALARAAWIEDRGEYEVALAQYDSIVEAARTEGNARRLGDVLQRKGRVYVQLGRFEDAQRAHVDARASFDEANGPNSLDHARILLDLSYLEVTRGNFDAATTLLTDLHERYAWLLERGSDLSNQVELAESKLAAMRGDYARAIEGFSRVAELGGDTVQRAEAWQALGVVRFYQGDMEGSLVAYRRARVSFLRALGPEHPNVGMLDSNIGESLEASGDHRGALAAFDKALTTLESTLPPDHLHLAFAHKGRAQTRLSLGDRDGARMELERALRIHAHDPAEPIERADAEFTLARVLLADGERHRALVLARTARARLLDLGAHAEQVEVIEHWIDEHD